MQQTDPGAAPGTPIHLVAHAPSQLMPVCGRDIQTAWEAARDAADRIDWGSGRIFRFRCDDGEGWTELALQDRDAQCWAAAVDRRFDLTNNYGVAICLRLLGLVDLLARAAWLSSAVCLDRRGGALPAWLARLAAETRLTDDAGFDEASFRAALVDVPAWKIPGELAS